jgi:MFS family permease
MSVDRRSLRSATPLVLFLCVGPLLSGVDLFVVNVGLPDIGTAVGNPSLADLSWVLDAYAIVFAALLVPAGRLADRFGNRRAVLVGLAVFAFASIAAGLSTQLWQIVAMRCLQAAGAATLVPATLGLILVVVPPGSRPRAVRIWAVSGSIGAAAGPALGGLLVELSWRWVFLFSAPVCLIALVGVLALAPPDRPATEQRTPDLLGGALLALAISLLVLALVEGGSWGWGSTRVLGALSAAAVVAAVLVRRSSRQTTPIVDLALFAVRPYVWSNAAYVVFALSFSAQLLALTLWLQNVWGWGPLATGLGLAPAPAVVFLVGLGLQRRLERLPDGAVAATGAVLLGLGALVIAQSVGPSPDYAAEILPGWLLVGAGVGLAIPTFVGAATRGLRRERASTGSAVVQMSRQIGSALGVAFLVIALGAGTVADFRLAWHLSAVVALLAAVPAAAISLRRP